jgi:uncharacterized protein YkwD
VLAIALAAVFATNAAQAATAAEPVVDPGFEQDVVAAINAARRAQGLIPLRRSAELTAAARSHGSSMARLGYFSHSSSDGASPTQRITSFYDVEGSSNWAVSEVLRWDLGTSDADESVVIWLASDGHRRELLRPAWRDIGVGVVHAADAPGVFAGRDVTIVVVNFGRR